MEQTSESDPSSERDTRTNTAQRSLTERGKGESESGAGRDENKGTDRDKSDRGRLGN